MAFPTLQNSKVDKLVTSILLAKVNEPGTYVQDAIFPTVPGISAESGLIGSIGNDHLRVFNSQRSVWDESEHRIKFEYSKDKRYQVNYHDLEVYLPDRIIEQAEQPFMPRRDALTTLLEALKIERERSIADLVTDTTVITNNVTLAGADQWNNQTTSKPEEDIQLAVDTVRQNSLRKPNKVVMPYSCFQSLKYHPFFVNRVNGINVLSEEQLRTLIKDIFGLEVLVAESQYVSSVEGQTETVVDTWGNDVVVFYSPETPSLFAPALGYHFTLSNRNLRVSQRRHSNDVGDINKVEWAYQDFLTMPEAGYLIKSAVA
jgi:hypothetical protein